MRGLDPRIHLLLRERDGLPDQVRQRRQRRRGVDQARNGTVARRCFLFEITVILDRIDACIRHSGTAAGRTRNAASGFFLAVGFRLRAHRAPE
jgi:hypothetical protein